MPFQLPIFVDYRAKMGLERRLRSELGVDIDRQVLADFISFLVSYAFDSFEWHGRLRQITLADLWDAFLRDQKGAGNYDNLTPPDVTEAKKKGRF